MPKRKWLLLSLWLIGGAVMLLMALPCFPGLGRMPTRPNILLISVDTLRADGLSLYGNARRTSPNLDALAKSGIVYADALSQAPWTLPSVASFNTSLYPSEHGATKVGKRLSLQSTTIAEVLKGAGYNTIGVISHDLVGKKHGFGQGFTLFDESQIHNQRTVTSQALTEVALGYLDRLKGDKPFFLWVHYFDPHFDYIRHPEFHYADATAPQLPGDFVRDRYSAGDPKRMYKKTKLKPLFLRHIRAVYDEEIAYTDRWLGKLFKGMADLGLSKRTVTIVTADHGEYFMERGRFLHDGDVYCELTHVPLIIGGAIDGDLVGRRVDRTVELVSLPRTMAAIAGVAANPFKGEDLLSLARGKPEPRYAFSEGTWAWKEDGQTAGVVFDGWKLILNFDDTRYELYHTAVDPKERQNLYYLSDPITSKVRKRLKRKLDDHVKSKMSIAPKAETVNLSEEDKARLRAIGYVE